MAIDVQKVRLDQREVALTEEVDSKENRSDAADRKTERADQRYQHQIVAIDRREDAEGTKSFWTKLTGGGAGFLSALSDLAGVLAASNPYTAAAFAIGKAVVVGFAGAATGREIGNKISVGARIDAADASEQARYAELDMQRFDAQAADAAGAVEDSTHELDQIQRLNEELQQMQDARQRPLA